jgi:tRNA threonylcarbamoyladenosine biosynthesis protein TsaB
MVYPKQANAMKLAIETATEVCSVALELDNNRVLEKRQVGKGVHSEKMFQFMEQLLIENQLEPEQISEVLLSIGPGQYTGLRIGAAGVKGFLMSKKTELYTIGTLEGFAAAISQKDSFSGNIHAVIDARREHLYHQKFELKEDRVLKSDASIQKITSIDLLVQTGDIIIGTGLERLEAYGSPGLTFFDADKISAKNLILARNDSRFGEFYNRTDPAEFEPLYLTTRQVNNTVINH